MPIAEGLYRAHFSTPSGQGTGVAHLAGGHITGGDSMMAYIGTFAEGLAGQLVGSAHIFKHSDVPGFVSALGTDDAMLQFTGSVDAGGGIQLSAPTPLGVPIHVVLTKIG